MNSAHTGEVLSLSLLPARYQLLTLGLKTQHAFVPGSYLQINGDNWYVMREKASQNQLELLSQNAATPPRVGEHAQFHIRETGFRNFQKHVPPCLLIGENLGLAAIVFLADQLRKQHASEITVLLGFDGEPPFRPTPSRIMVPYVPPHVIASVPLLEEWGIASRIALNDFNPGCYEDGLGNLLAHVLAQRETTEKLEIFTCVKPDTQVFIRELAEEHQLSCQIIEV